MTRRIVYKHDIPGPWPFKDYSVVMGATKAGGIIVRFRDKVFGRRWYAVNGTAMRQGSSALPLRRWRDNMEIPGTKINMSPLIRWAMENIK